MQHLAASPEAAAVTAANHAAREEARRQLQIAAANERAAAQDARGRIHAANAAVHTNSFEDTQAAGAAESAAANATRANAAPPTRSPPKLPPPLRPVPTSFVPPARQDNVAGAAQEIRRQLQMAAAQDNAAATGAATNDPRGGQQGNIPAWRSEQARALRQQHQDNLDRAAAIAAAQVNRVRAAVAASGNDAESDETDNSDSYSASLSLGEDFEF